MINIQKFSLCFFVVEFLMFLIIFMSVTVKTRLTYNQYAELLVQQSYQSYWKLSSCIHICVSLLGFAMIQKDISLWFLFLVHRITMHFFSFYEMLFSSAKVSFYCQKRLLCLIQHISNLKFLPKSVMLFCCCFMTKSF